MVNPSEEEWNAFKAEMRGLYYRVADATAVVQDVSVRRDLGDLRYRGVADAHQKFLLSIGIAVDGQRTVPYLAHHIAVGSTPDRQWAPYLDFPEPYSLKSLFERILMGQEPGFEALAAQARQPACTTAAPPQPCDPT